MIRTNKKVIVKTLVITFIILIIIILLHWIWNKRNETKGTNRQAWTQNQNEKIVSSMTNSEIESYIKNLKLTKNDYQGMIDNIITQWFYNNMVEYKALNTHEIIEKDSYHNQYFRYMAYYKGYQIVPSQTTLTKNNNGQITLSHNKLEIGKIERDLAVNKWKKILSVKEIKKAYPDLRTTNYYIREEKPFITKTQKDNSYHIVITLQNNENEYLIDMYTGEIIETIPLIRTWQTQFKADIKYKWLKNIPWIKYDNSYADSDWNWSPQNSQSIIQTIQNGNLSVRECNMGSPSNYPCPGSSPLSSSTFTIENPTTDLTNTNNTIWNRSINMFWHINHFKNTVQRNRDVKGMNRAEAYNNAYRDGYNINLFQDGTKADDVIYHELWHWLNQDEYPGNMNNWANNEGIADVRAYIVDLDQDDIMGENRPWGAIRFYNGTLKSVNTVSEEVHSLGEPIAGSWIKLGKLSGKSIMKNIFENTRKQHFDSNTCYSSCNRTATINQVYVPQFEYALEQSQFKTPLCNNIIKAFRATDIAQHSTKKKNNIPYYDEAVCFTCNQWDSQFCKPENMEGVCALSGTQTCIQIWWDLDRSECIPVIAPWQIPEGTWEAATCGDWLDNDCNGLTDCAETWCTLWESAWENNERIICQATGESICNDGGDNDWDSYIIPPTSWGGTDCWDSDCNGLTGSNGIICQYEHELTCNDWGDNDGDGLKDCDDDKDCGIISTIESSKGTWEFCGDTTLTLKAIIDSSTGVDENDIVRSNGMTGTMIEITLSWPNNKTETYTVSIKNANGCSTSSSITIKYRSSKTEICDNLVDDDCDLLKDCKDTDDCDDACKTCVDVGFDCSQPECQGMSYCNTYESNCCDKFDNDNDGSIDCEDSDCLGKPGCAITNIIGGLPVSPTMFATFKSEPKYVEGALYIEFKKNIREDFQEKLNQKFNNIHLSQPFQKILWLDTRRLDFDSTQYSKEQIENYIKNIYEDFVPVTQPVPLFKISTFQSNDELLQQQRYLHAIKIANIDQCGNQGEKKNKIAIVDNAFDISHEDLSKGDIEGYDIADNDNDVSIPKKLLEWNHGTVAWGIVGAIINNQKGIAGITNKSPLILIKATSDISNGTDVTAGIEWLLKAAEMWADIINISRGTHEKVPLLEKVVNKLTQEWITLVAAAGNQNSDQPFYPAAYKKVIAVWAYDQNKNKASFSNFGKRIDVWAPGTNITTTNIANQYTTIDGTSEASPIVAATLGLLSDNNIKPQKYIKSLEKFSNNYPGKKLSLETICTTRRSNKTTGRIWVVSTVGTIVVIISMGIVVSKKYSWFKSSKKDEDE